MKIILEAHENDYNMTERELQIEPTLVEGQVWIIVGSTKVSVSAKELKQAIESFIPLKS